MGAKKRLEPPMMALYSLALGMVLALSSPYWLARMFFPSKDRGKYRAGLWGRLGRVPQELRDAVAGKQVVWLHAVSVGEVLAATRLVAEIEAALGVGWIIVVSTTTATGQRLARERFGGQAEGGAGRVFWYPLDFAWAVRAYLRVLKPKMLVLMESELWPRMLVECERRGVPVAVVNARVSDRSYARGLKVRAVWGHVLRRVTLFLAQSEEDERRLVEMGARASSVRVVGNLKYDVRAPKESKIAELIRVAAAGRPIVVAGSTVDSRYQPEEQIVMQELMGPVWQMFPEALLVVAPRQPERFNTVATEALDFGATVKASELLVRSEVQLLSERILVLDTIGDLARMYSVADVAFVGGSLVPKGGHNPLEPAQFGVPVVMGPSFENFRDVVHRMQDIKAIFIVRDGMQGHEFLLDALLKKPWMREAGENGRRVFEEQQGATKRTVEALMELVKR